MNKSYRIKTNIDEQLDKNIKIKIDSDTRFLEILSLKIDQRDTYQFFNADYGVLVGRVIANGGVGIPNAKVSVFIPVEEADLARAEIKAIYPYENPRDKNSNGKRYNLLPRVATTREDGTVKPQQPFGSFPLKEEVVTNETWLEVYEKYYKYTTVTNSSGDYMIFGVPIGTQTVHMSVDVTDIGRFSMTPATLVTNLGYSPNLFTNNNSRIKPSRDLEDLPNIETQEISVDVIPFWGDSDNFEIGITRQDFRIRAELISTFTIFGSAFTDSQTHLHGDSTANNPRQSDNYRTTFSGNVYENLGIQSKRIGLINESFFYYPANVTDAQISAGTVNTQTDIVRLDEAEYSSFKRDGDFIFILPCNRRKIITNEFGQDVVVPNDSVNGVFTEFNGFMTATYDGDELSLSQTNLVDNDVSYDQIRHKLKIPQSSDLGETFRSEANLLPAASAYTETWRKQSFKFSFNNFYSVAKFNGTVSNFSNNNSQTFNNATGFIELDNINFLFTESFQNPGVIITEDFPPQAPINSIFEYPANGFTKDGPLQAFGNQWMNFNLYIQQTGRVVDGGSFINGLNSNTQYNPEPFNNNFAFDNLQPLWGGLINSKWYARSDIHKTDFIEVPLEDILNILSDTNLGKGFIDNELTTPLVGNYKNGGNIGGDPGNPVDPNFYFYRGFNTSDCIQYLQEQGLI